MLKAWEGDCNASFPLLEEAVKFGFRDSNRIKNEAVLKACLNDPYRLSTLFSRMARSL